jgi:hypothetical protein
MEGEPQIEAFYQQFAAMVASLGHTSVLDVHLFPSQGREAAKKVTVEQ